MKKHYNIRVRGRVQGVSYRANARDAAEELGLTGFVRNEPDGTVYAEAEGSEEALQRFIDWCKSGSDMANVNDVDYEEGVIQDFETFRIAR